MMKRLGAVCVVISLASCADASFDREPVATTSAALDAVTGFGTNPGNLAMYRYAPAGMPAKAPIVVALHGCTQSAAAFSSVGLNALADQYKFYVVYPQQNAANNPVSCFDWWGAYNNPSDKTNITRDKGEDLSIKQMVDKTAADFSTDPSRVFVIGFSAGAAMAAVLLATYPDVFAAGAIDAGVPYDCPSTTNSDVFTCMSPGKTLAASDWGQRVTSAFAGYAGKYPRVSIWQGTADHTVATANRVELVKQWTDVHGLTSMPTQTDMVDGYPHAVYADANHVVQVESYDITGMDHGVAVDPAHGCGTAGAYVIDKGICSVHHMLDFFGVTAAVPTTDGGASSGDGGSGGGSGGVDAGCCGAHDMDGGAMADSCFVDHGASKCSVGWAKVASDRAEILFAALGVALVARRRRRRARA
jgi:poly(hydroxyalkanoate) depolymerase family esterase